MFRSSEECLCRVLDFERIKNSWTLGKLSGCGVLPDQELKDLTKVFLVLCYQFMEPNARLLDRIKNESSSFRWDVICTVSEPRRHNIDAPTRVAYWSKELYR
jgi:hypothetical protein